MNESFAIFQKINWFIKPVSDFLIFLFTRPLGYVILISFFLLYVVFSASNALRVRSLAHRAANNGKTPFVEMFYIIGSEFIKIFLKVFSNLPVLLTVIFLMFGVVGLSTSFQTFDTFFQNNQKIKELQSVLKHLDQRYEVATIEILNVDWINDSTKFEVSFFDYSEDKYLDQTQQITIKGKDIYFLSYVMNFDYSEIESGEKKNIVVPFKVFSEDVPSANGIALNVLDSCGIPYIFHRSDDDLYGITKETYNTRLQEIAEYMTNEEKAKEAGIRSFYEAAPHNFKVLKPGQKITIWVEQTGGLVIKEVEDF